MIPELYHPLETDTLMGLVSYGDPDYEEPEKRDWLDAEGDAAPRRSVLGRGRRSWSSVRSKGESWFRRGRRLIALRRSR